MVAGGFRFWTGYAIAFYMPDYFQSIYPDNYSLYSALNAGVVSVGGFASSMIGGYLSDKYEPRNAMTKAYVCMYGTLLGIPTLAGTLLFGNFSLSITMLFLEYLVAECWLSPAISLIQATIPVNSRGVAISVYLLYITAFGTLSNFLTGVINEAFNSAENPQTKPWILFIVTASGYALSVPCFYLAGRNYCAFKA